MAIERFVTISGCSGGGKSTLLSELARRGYATVEEPGRRIVKQELASAGRALPWIDAEAFLHRAIAMAEHDCVEAAKHDGWVFFDRGLLDAALGLEFLTREPALQALSGLRFNRRVFLTPPWPEIYCLDSERRHGLDEAIAEYKQKLGAYRALGYDPILLPKISVSERADFVLSSLG